MMKALHLEAQSPHQLINSNLVSCYLQTTATSYSNIQAGHSRVGVTCVCARSSCGLMWPCLQYLAAEKVNRDSGSSKVNTLKMASSTCDLVDRNSWEMLLCV